MKKLALSFLAVFTALSFLDAGCASADVVTITSSGIWAPDSAVTDVCAPGAAWTLTLTVDSPLLDDAGGTEFDASAVSGSYQFGTTANSFTAVFIRFYPSEYGGGFGVSLGNTDSSFAVNATQFFDSNTLALVPGTYQSQPINAYADNGFGGSTADVVVTGAVPEPSTWSLLAVGSVGTVVMTLRRRRTRA